MRGHAREIRRAILEDPGSRCRVTKSLCSCRRASGAPLAAIADVAIAGVAAVAAVPPQRRNAAH
eukprot:7486074-Pyramimonas_sp.AAC.1